MACIVEGNETGETVVIGGAVFEKAGVIGCGWEWVVGDRGRRWGGGIAHIWGDRMRSVRAGVTVEILPRVAWLRIFDKVRKGFNGEDA